MTVSEKKERFLLLCEQHGAEADNEARGINTYNEKSLHRILKALYCADRTCYEAPVGPYIADILEDGQITEIQTGSLYPLQKKIAYYLSGTEYKVRIVHPMICQKRIIRVQCESGEVLRDRVSPKHKGAKDILPELMWLGECFACDRLTVELVMISATERRFSDERVRHRKSGAYDSITLPDSLRDVYTISSSDDVRALIKGELLEKKDGFTAATFGRAMGFSGRRNYAALAALVNMGILVKTKSEGSRAAIYYPV